MGDIRGEFREIAEALFNNAADGFSGLPASAQKVFLSVCYGRQRAKTVKGIGGALRAAFDAAFERTLKIVSQKEALPKWVMINVVAKEIPCPAAEYYDILNKIKPGYLRYGVSFDSRYANVFLEQEIHAASMIKYGSSKHSLDAAKITEYMRVQGGGGTGVTFSAPGPDSPVILFEVKSWFYDNGEYFEIDSSPASLRVGQRVADFEGNAELRLQTARRVAASCFTADCRTEGLAGCLDGKCPPRNGEGSQNNTGVEKNSLSAINQVSAADWGDARFLAALPSVMFPETAMFFESPETVVYGVYVRGKNFDARDGEAARFFADYYNRYKNAAGTNGDGGGEGTGSKIITARYNPYAHKIAEAYGLADNEFENVYDFFQDAVHVDIRETGLGEVEKHFSAIKSAGAADKKNSYTRQKVEYVDNPADFGYRLLKGDACEAYAHFEGGALSYISRYDAAKKRERRAVYDCRGFLSCERVMTDERLTLTETFFTPGGGRALEKAYRIENGVPEVMAVKVKFDGTWRCFSDEEELFAFYRNVSAAQTGGVPPVSKETGVEAGIQPAARETAGGLALSIIIPHYNRAELIIMCLDTISVNDYPQDLYEVIVVDDCSTENIDAVRDYSKIKNFRFCQLEKNSGGASAPRNYGLASAKGEYALFIDSDDAISARLLSESMKIARLGGCDAVVIPKISLRSSAAAFRTLTDDLTKIKLDGLSDLSILVASDNYAIGKLFRMDLVRRFGIHFPENLVYSEDTCFCRWFYAVSKTMGVCASESYYLRDWDGGTLSHYVMSNNEVYEHVSFIARNIFGVPDGFAPIDKKARAMDGSLKHEGVCATLNTPYYTALLQEKYGEHFAAMKNAPRISKETREFVDAIINAKQAARREGKLEVVFMPYRASTWDSLESIWYAAKEDPDCDAYVVPLPYRDPESGKTVSDAESLPAYVPVTRYGEYDLCARLPDIVYINDPYDQYREIAPIDSKYFSYNLKKYTGMLVYVPYYCLVDENVSPDSELYKAFVYVSTRVDRVITQSEKVSASYAGDAASNKLAALGSPKMDRLINAKKEDYALPEGWEKIIGGKKVVLYNTHLINIRDPKRDMLGKLRYVMGVFEKRYDVVLWWRPHPSIEVELKTRNPRMLDDYRRLVEEYKAAGFGIYDDTPDLHRAIAWCDAYYGDGGSLLQMCGVTGKPIMIHDAMRKNENSDNLLFILVHDDGENFWFTAHLFNALFKMDKQDWSAECMGSFPNEMGGALYGHIIEHGGKLYFTPWYANEIAVYDIASGNFEKISFAESPKGADKDNNNAMPKFYAAAVYGKYIFFIGYYYPAIMRLDTESGGLDYFTNWVEPLAEISDGGGYYFRDVRVFGNRLLMPAISANAVAEFDMDKCVTRIYEVGNKEQKYHAICFDGENYWLAPRFDGAVVKWNPDTKECWEYSGYPVGLKFGQPDIGASFSGVTYWGGYIWLLPYAANTALKINVSDGSMSIAEEFMSECNFKGEEVLTWNCHLSLAAGEKLYAHTGKTNRFVEYDFKTKQRWEEAIVLSEEAAKKLNENYPAMFYKNVRRRLSVNECNVYERHPTALQVFLNYIVNEREEKTALSAKQIEAYSESVANADGTCGAKIHEYVKNEALNLRQAV